MARSLVAGCIALSGTQRWGCRFSSSIAFKASSFTENGKVSLEKGMLVQFQKKSETALMGVIQHLLGKNSWAVVDQREEVHHIHRKQIKLVVPGAVNYKPGEIGHLLEQAERLQDSDLLERAWEELLSKNISIDLEEMSLVLYGSNSPEKCYGAYQLLSSHPAYFECKEEGFSLMYEPRSLALVKEIQLQQLQEKRKQACLMDFVSVVKSMMEMPAETRPGRGFWQSKKEFKHLLSSLESFAIDRVRSLEEKHNAMKVLECLEADKIPMAAINVLIQMGYFGVHENLDLLKLDLRREFPQEVLADTEMIKKHCFKDLDKGTRVDLTSLKVLTIDTDNPYEIDDGLSAIQLPDGRFKVWIHVADATCCVDWASSLRKEAGRRCTSIYFPTGMIPMFPTGIAADIMSLRQEHTCLAVSVSVTLGHDGSIAESTVENAVVCPTHKLSYAVASEMLSLNVEDKTELSTLYKAALLRNKWRLSKGAVDIRMPKTTVIVKGENMANPTITLLPDDSTSSANMLVSEMMILCGEVIAKFGSERDVHLPYRGQVPANEGLVKEIDTIPEGYARSAALLRCMSRTDINFLKPLQHASLGLFGYVQFTSPIRRYVDLLAHYQVKAVLRGLDPPLKWGYLEASMVIVNTACRIAKKVEADSERYWKLEYLRRRPQNEKYLACILRLLKNNTALILLPELGMQCTMDLKIKRQVGEELYVCVQDSQPRQNILLVGEA